MSQCDETPVKHCGHLSVQISVIQTTVAPPALQQSYEALAPQAIPATFCPSNRLKHNGRVSLCHLLDRLAAVGGWLHRLAYGGCQSSTCT